MAKEEKEIPKRGYQDFSFKDLPEEEDLTDPFAPVESAPLSVGGPVSNYQEVDEFGGAVTLPDPEEPNNTGFLDDWWVDDLGGVLSGESDQWVPEIPYLTDGYRNSLGAVFDVGLDLGGALFDWANWGSEQADHLGAWAWSVLPFGIETLEMDWQGFSIDEGIGGDASLVSAGQSYGSMIGAIAADGMQIGTDDFNITLDPAKAFYDSFVAAEDFVGLSRVRDNIGPSWESPETQQWLEANALNFTEGFDVLDPEQKKIAFEDQLIGKLGSGFYDFGFDIFADPTIVGGKLTSILRYGVKSGSWAGTSNVALNNPAQRLEYATKIDEGISIRLSDPEVKLNAPATYAEEFATKASEDLTGHPWLTNSNDQMGVLKVHSSMTEEPLERLAQSAAVGKALVGERSGWVTLFEDAPEVFDALFSYVSKGADSLAAGPTGFLDATQTALARNLVNRALVSIDEFPDAMAPSPLPLGRPVRPLVEMPEGQGFEIMPELPVSQIVQRGGSRFGPVARAGAAKRSGYSNKSASYGVDGWVQQTIKTAAGSRPITVLRWMGQGRPTGIIHLKGGDGVESNIEARNWLRASNISEIEQTRLFDNFINANTVDGRRNIVIEMEVSEIAATARKLDMEIEDVAKVYNSYRGMRRKKLWEQRKSIDDSGGDGGVAFSIDESGNVITYPGLYSELDEAFPMLNIKEFQRVVTSNKSWIRGLSTSWDGGASALDVLNNMWKVGVLLRLGYTMRNLTEGALRSAATVGVLAANPQALMRVPSSIKYRAYKAYYTGSRFNRGKLDAPARALNDAREELYEARNSITEWNLQARTEEIDRLAEQVRDLENALAVARARLDLTPRLEVDVPFVRGTKKPDTSNPKVALGKVEIELKRRENRRVELERDRRLLLLDNPNASTKRVDELIRKNEEAIAVRKPKIEAERQEMRAKEVKRLEAAGVKELEKIRIENRKRYSDYEKQKANRAKDDASRDKEIADIEKELLEKREALDEVSNLQFDTRIDGKSIDDLYFDAENAASIIDEQIADLDLFIAKLNAKKSKLDRVGEGGVVLKDSNGKPIKDKDGNNIVYDAAFDGSDGAIARKLASADTTFRNVFETGFERRVASMKSQKKYVGTNPNTLRTAEEWKNYWLALTTRINQTYRQDRVVGKVWLARGDNEGDMLERTREWMMSRSGQEYRSSVRTPDGKKLSDSNGAPIPERIDDWIADTYRRYTEELPPGVGIREKLIERELMQHEVQSAFNKVELPTIPAPEMAAAPDEIALGLGGYVTSKYNRATGVLMKYLGSVPEDKLLRHPFYSASFRKEQDRLVRLAISDGRNLNDSIVRKSVNAGAHREALKQTRKTMYTIERQSNISNALRFVMPFFPAWENSIRTWGRIAYREPAVIGAANLAWNIPNSLGMVVNENGERVEWSNYLGDRQDAFIVQHESVSRALAKIHGVPFAGQYLTQLPILNTLMAPLDEDGNPMPVKVRQSGLDTVFPGGIFDPGIGPMQTIPVSLFLRGKPELVESIRKSVGDENFRKLIPNGDVNTSVMDQFFPTTIKRLKDKVFAGENENTAYLRLKDTMIQDEIIRAAMAGQKVTDKDMERVLKRAEDFWDWSIGQAATGFTASSSYNSPFSVERKIWRDLLDNQALPYSEKIKAFMRKVEIRNPGADGEDFMAITRSTTESPFKVNANKMAYDRLTKDPALIEELSEMYGEEAVGQYTNIGDWQAPYDPSVYSELRSVTIGNDPAKEKQTPEQVRDANEIGAAWREYFLFVEQVDEYAISKGFTSYKDIPKLSSFFKERREALGVKYPAFGTVLEAGYDSSGINKRIAVSRRIVSNASQSDFDSNPTIGVLSKYLEFRETVSYALSLYKDDDEARKKIRKSAYQKVGEYRRSNIGFADYYDKYLELDDFREIYN